MLPRTEELGHIPSYQLKTPSQLKITARKLTSFILLDFKYTRLWNQKLDVKTVRCALMTTDCHTPRGRGLLSSPTGLPHLQLCHLLPEMCGNEAGGPWAGAVWTCTSTFKQEQQRHVFPWKQRRSWNDSRRGFLPPLSLPSETQKLLGDKPAQNAAPPAVISRQQGTERGRLLATAPGWPGCSQTHPLLQRHSHVVCLWGIQWESVHGSPSYKYQRDKLRTWSNRDKRRRNTHFG